MTVGGERLRLACEEGRRAAWKWCNNPTADIPNPHHSQRRLAVAYRVGFEAVVRSRIYHSPSRQTYLASRADTN